MPTEQPRRRGRPPGSPNRPKTTVPRNLELPTSSITTGPTLVPLGDPVPYDQAGYVGYPTGPDPVRVILSHKGRAFGDPAQDHEIEWPPEWRFPQSGDVIFLSEKWGGVVQAVEFWKTESRAHIVIRLI